MIKRKENKPRTIFDSNEFNLSGCIIRKTQKYTKYLCPEIKHHFMQKVYYAIKPLKCSSQNKTLSNVYSDGLGVIMNYAIDKLRKPK